MDRKTIMGKRKTVYPQTQRTSGSGIDISCGRVEILSCEPDRPWKDYHQIQDNRHDPHDIRGLQVSYYQISGEQQKSCHVRCHAYHFLRVTSVPHTKQTIPIANVITEKTGYDTPTAAIYTKNTPAIVNVICSMRTIRGLSYMKLITVLVHLTINTLL